MLLFINEEERNNFINNILKRLENGEISKEKAVNILSEFV